MGVKLAVSGETAGVSVHATDARRSVFDRKVWPVGSLLLGAVALVGLVTPTNGASIVVAPIGAVVALPGFLASSWSLRLLSFAGLTVNVGLIALAVWWVRTYGGI